MGSNFVRNRLSSGSLFNARERRKNLRYGMRFPILLRTQGDVWAVGETADVGAAGTFFVTHRHFAPGTIIEYVLTFPPELTKAAHPLRLRFFGMVLRCEPIANPAGFFGIAVRNTAHRYLSREESASFDAMEQQFPATSNSDDPSTTQ